MATLDEFGIGRRKLPDPAHTPIAAFRLKRHPLDIPRIGLKVVEARVAANRVAKRLVRRDVVHALTVQVNLATITERRNMLTAILDHFPSPDIK